MDSRTKDDIVGWWIAKKYLAGNFVSKIVRETYEARSAAA
jgi:hypothetical protein